MGLLEANIITKMLNMTQDEIIKSGGSSKHPRMVGMLIQT